MTLVRWDPFRELMNMSRQLNTTFGEDDDSYGSWAPPVDIFERDDHLVIRAELPGVDRDAIDVQVENNRLILTGERKSETEVDNDNVYRRERRYGKFVRSFALPRTVDSSKIGATYKDGVLELTLPKSEQAKPRRIQVS